MLMAGEHVRQHGTRGAELHMVILAILYQAIQFIGRTGPQRCQPAHGGADQFTPRRLHARAKFGIGETTADSRFAALALLGGLDDRRPAGQRQQQRFVTVFLPPRRHLTHL